MFKHKKVGLGGTFDHFHSGHQAFLLFASELAEQLVIGITTPEMITHKNNNIQIDSYEVRSEAVKSFTKNFFNKVDVIPLTDPYGPTLLGSNVDALAATSATKSGAEAVNIKRNELGLSSLPIYIRELELDENGLPLASERIRNGEINRRGKVYENILKSTLVLTNQQKMAFAEPQGELVRHPSPTENIFIVGDTSLEYFIKNQWPYQLGVIDFLKQRKPYQPPVIVADENSIHTSNQAGTISSDLKNSLKKALINKTKHVIVSGEEDLAAVVLVLLAPLGSHIYYGQPQKGMIELRVTEEKKEHIAKILLS